MSDDFVDVITSCLKDGQNPVHVADLIRKVLAPKLEPTQGEIHALDVKIKRALPDGADRIALVYGGATKIKGYVFESPRLPEIRGASALLDRINVDDMRGLWDGEERTKNGLIFASGGNLLGFAPPAQAQALANEIEKSYTQGTLTANSIAVAQTFDLIELAYGLRPTEYWVEDFERDWLDESLRGILQQYYYGDKGETPRERFFRRKHFGELVTLLATEANKRRESMGDDKRRDPTETDRSRRDIPHYTLDPWAAKCASSDIRPAVTFARTPNQQSISQASALKLYVGQKVKRIPLAEKNKHWYDDVFMHTHERAAHPTIIPLSWEARFMPEANTTFPQTPIGEVYREWQKDLADTDYYKAVKECASVRSARDIDEIAQASSPSRFVGMIYADGNNVGRRVATAKTLGEYKSLSRDLERASTLAVFRALAQHLRPTRVAVEGGGQEWVHPFEIITIGGDDLLILVPGSAALDIALAIGYEFEHLMIDPKNQEQGTQGTGRFVGTPHKGLYDFRSFASDIGLSAGVLIAPENTPIFFMRDLVETLLKNAKKKAKDAQPGNGGAVDFMVLKSISMVTDDITTFRERALGTGAEHHMRLTARPYNWPELRELLYTIRALREQNIPRSQIYRLRERLFAALDEGGLHPSIVDYLYLRTKGLSRGDADVLAEKFDMAWHSLVASRDVAPWKYRPKGPDSNGKPKPDTHPEYETLWPDIVELYDFVDHGVEGQE